MTTTETTGASGSGDGEQPKQTPEAQKDKEVVKEEVVAATTEAIKKVRPAGRGGKVAVPGNLFRNALGGTGMAARKPTAESVKKREEEGIKAKEEAAAKKKSIEDEFWGAVETLGAFDYSKVSSGKHLEGGEDPDQATIEFFADMTPDQWLIAQSRDKFVLTRSTSEKFGDGISFTVYFREDLKGKRRSVAGYLQQGKLTIVHVGPVQ